MTELKFLFTGVSYVTLDNLMLFHVIMYDLDVLMLLTPCSSVQDWRKGDITAECKSHCLDQDWDYRFRCPVLYCH